MAAAVTGIENESASAKVSAHATVTVYHQIEVHCYSGMDKQVALAPCYIGLAVYDAAPAIYYKDRDFC